MGHWDQPDKIKALLLFITDQFNNRSEASSTKLNKAFYFIDFGHYALHGETITDFEYKKQKFGPIAYGLPDHLNALEIDQVLNKTRVQFSLGIEPRATYIPLVQVPNLEEYFTFEEIDTIRRTVDALKDRSANKDSIASHYHNSWITGKIWDTIPLEYAKSCEFPWLNYYGSDENRDDYEETQRLREIARQSHHKFADRKAKISFG